MKEEGFDGLFSSISTPTEGGGINKRALGRDGG